MTGLDGDLAGLHLKEEMDEAEREREKEKYKERAVNMMKVEELVMKVKKEEESSGRKNISLIVVGEWSFEVLSGRAYGRPCGRWEIDIDGEAVV